MPSSVSSMGLALLLSGIISGCAIQNSQSAFWPDRAPEITSALYSRAGITVSNMDESLAFYRDTLGMTVLVDRLGKTDARLSAFSGLTENQAIRLVILRTETSGGAQLNAGYIGLAEITETDGTPIEEKDALASDGFQPGSIMLMFVVDNVQDVYSEVSGGRYEIISPPRQREDGSWSELLMRGPNNERLWITDRYRRNILVEKTVR